jgi:hypothetical protein
LLHRTGIYYQCHAGRPAPVTGCRELWLNTRELQLAAQPPGTVQVDTVGHMISVDCHRLNCLRPVDGAPPTYLGSLMRFCYCRRDQRR